MTRRKILLTTFLISIISSSITYWILILFYGFSGGEKSLVVSFVIFVITLITSYRYLIRAFYYDLG